MEKVSFDIELGDLELALSDRQLSPEEKNKEKNGLLGGERLRTELENLSKPDIEKDLHLNLKSHGIYIQFERAKIKQGSKAWFFMVRCSIWGGGNISSAQWLHLSTLADLYSRDDDGSSSMRLTTRQSIQFHRVTKENLIPLIRGLIDVERKTLNGCGDNTRNPVACPHISNIFDSNELAQKMGEYFQLPVEEYFKVFYPDKNIPLNGSEHFAYDCRGLPRKFKIGIGGYYIDEYGNEVRCNCADILSNDVGITPIVRDKAVIGYQVYIGGGLGQKNMKATFPSLAGPFGIFNSIPELIKGLDAIVRVYSQVGDRNKRHWARLKNILIKKGQEKLNYTIEEIISEPLIFKMVRNEGITWYKGEVRKPGINFSEPLPIHPGHMNRHHGWIKQYDGNYSFGMWIENGRLKDTSSQGKIKSLADKIVMEINPDIRITPYQDILFTNLDENQKQQLEQMLIEFKYGNYSIVRTTSLACVGLFTCSLAVTESEKYFTELMDDLEKEGYGNLEGIGIGISGCERHCPRNIRFDISIEGKANDIYQLKLLFGKAEDENLALDLVSGGKKYLRHIPQPEIPGLIKAIIRNYLENKFPEENSIAEFHKRIGMEAVIAMLKNNAATAHLMEKTYDPYLA